MAINIGNSATQDFATSYHRSELHVSGTIFTLVIGVSWDQPTESAAVKGTQPQPVNETVGSMDKGELTVTFSEETERQRLFALLGNGYREKKVPILWKPGGANGKVVYKFDSCRVLSDPGDHSEGPDALGGDVVFSFLGYTRNGLAPHTGTKGSGGFSNGSGLNVGI